ncbi:hypothetical protein N7523_004713 [Penicillium sp. IBT 18751x]|nr:hypothetical protein N7523_004713 [Penicillium sp. IBT 18751x]
MPAIPLTPSRDSSRTVVTADQFKIQSQFEDALYDTLCNVQGFHELVITKLPPGWENFIWDIEESPRLPHVRKSYDPASRTLRLKIMPTYPHNCVAEWISTSIAEARGTGFLDFQELRLILLQADTNGPYCGLRKEPDALLHTPSQPFPTLVAEVGWSESYTDLLADMNKLLIGGNGAIKIVLLVKWTKHTNGSVSGTLELYRNDRQGIPKLRQTEVIFPMPAGDPLQPLQIQRRDLYPPQAPRNPSEDFPLFVQHLRYHARISLRKEGYVPA